MENVWTAVPYFLVLHCETKADSSVNLIMIIINSIAFDHLDFALPTRYSGFKAPRGKFVSYWGRGGANNNNNNNKILVKIKPQEHLGWGGRKEQSRAGVGGKHQELACYLVSEEYYLLWLFWLY